MRLGEVVVVVVGAGGGIRGRMAASDFPVSVGPQEV